MLELPHIICQQGTGTATAEAKWKDGPQQIASASHSLTGSTHFITQRYILVIRNEKSLITHILQDTI